MRVAPSAKYWLGLSACASLLIGGCMDGSSTGAKQLSGAGANKSPVLIVDKKAPAVSTSSGKDGFDFTFNAFGDSGWADTHNARPRYLSGFKKAYVKFDPAKSLIGDINYVNWETSVGNVCTSFWSSPSSSTYAFLTRPEELNDVMLLGFNIIGLANNHSYDCLSSPEGRGPLQTLAHVTRLKEQAQSSGKTVLMSGVFQLPRDVAPQSTLTSSSGEIPVRFISAYVGGDAAHCKNIVCDQHLERYKSAFASDRGLRILALHSWDSSSHRKLQTILRNWLSRGLVDVAIGTGPHVAERVTVVKTPRGVGILATSLGNFIHPSLSPQSNNIVLRTWWTYRPANETLTLKKVVTTVVSCDGGACRKGASRKLF